MAFFYDEPSHTFGEYLLVPGYSSEHCIPANVSLRTPLVKYKKGEEPSLTYKVYALEDGEYTLQADFTPTNPLSRTGKLRYGVAVNGKAAGEYNTVPNGYRAGVAVDKIWSQGVLSHRRSCTSKVNLKKGVNEITLLLKDPGLVPAKLYLYTENPPTSYFGMPESKRK